MDVSVEKISVLGRRLTVDLPKDLIQSKEQDKIEKLAKTAKIAGFRAGKVPMSVLMQRYGDDVRREVFGEVLQSSMLDACKENDLKPIGTPVLEQDFIENGDTFQYILSFEVFPTIDLKDFAKIKLEKAVFEVTDEDIDSGIERIRVQFATWDNVECAAKKGDKLIIDFVGTINNEPFENGSANDVELEIGAERFIPGFEEGLIGAKAGDKCDLNVTFPKDYQARDLAGKEAVFAVTVKTVQEPQLAPLDAEFAKRIGEENSDASKIRDQVRANMQQYAASIVQANLREQVYKKILQVYDLEVPAKLIEQEEKALQQEQERKNAKQQTATTLTAEELSKEAKDRVKLALILNEVVSHYKLEPDSSRIQVRLEELAKSFGMADNQEFVHKLYRESAELMEGLKNSILTDQATDLVIEKATIKEKSSTFKEVADSSP